MSDHFHKTVTINTVDEDARTATGAVLVPDELDHQRDFFRPEAVERFHSEDPETGVMHAAFPDGTATFERLEVLDESETIDGDQFPPGTLVGTRRYEDDDLWQLVKDGVLTGFSIGGDVTAAEEYDTLPEDVRVPEAVEYEAGPVTELVDGEINEVSDVDLPAVPRATYKGDGLGKSIFEDVDGEAEFVAIMTEERGHSEADARRLYQYLTDARAKADAEKPFESPEGAEFEDFEDCVSTLQGDQDLTREEAEAICGAWQDADKRRAAAAERDSSTDMSQTSSDDEPDDATKWRRFKAWLTGSDDADAAEAPGRTKATDGGADDDEDEDDEDDDEEMAADTDKDAPAGETADTTMSDDEDTTKTDDEPPAWAADLTEKVDAIDDCVSKMEADGDEDAEKAITDAPEWAQALAEKVDDLDARVETISKQSGHSQQLGKADTEDSEKTNGFTLDPRKARGGD